MPSGTEAEKPIPSFIGSRSSHVGVRSALNGDARITVSPPNTPCPGSGTRCTDTCA